MTFPAKPRRFFGNRDFYKMVLMIVVPIMVQNTITNFVSLLDNLMVGSIGTNPMSGVAISNQLMYVFNITEFGAVSGAGIFSAQFFGAGNTEGVRSCFRYKLWICTGVAVAAMVTFLGFGERLVSLYLNDDNVLRVAETLDYGVRYLRIMSIGLIPFALSMVYAGTLREVGETRVPMIAGVAAVAVNLIFNYLLIFGKLGFPCLGVEGAAIATVLSRFVELAFIMIYVHTHTKKHAFADGLFSTILVPGKLAKDITKRGTPLLLNELLYSLSMTVLVQFFSLRGLDVVAAQNISSTVQNLFVMTFMSMGHAVSIIVGHSLGAGRTDEAIDRTWMLCAFSLFIALFFGTVLVFTADSIPLLYNTTTEVRRLAASMLRICALVFPAHSIVNSFYFTLRAGGKTVVTFIFDSGFCCLVFVPVALVLAHFTTMPIIPMFLCVRGLEYLKSVMGALMVSKGIWINNIVS